MNILTLFIVIPVLTMTGIVLTKDMRTGQDCGRHRNGNSAAAVSGSDISLSFGTPCRQYG